MSIDDVIQSNRNHSANVELLQGLPWKTSSISTI